MRVTSIVDDVLRTRRPDLFVNPDITIQNYDGKIVKTTKKAISLAKDIYKALKNSGLQNYNSWYACHTAVEMRILDKNFVPRDDYVDHYKSIPSDDIIECVGTQGHVMARQRLHGKKLKQRIIKNCINEIRYDYEFDVSTWNTEISFNENGTAWVRIENPRTKCSFNFNDIYFEVDGAILEYTLGV